MKHRILFVLIMVLAAMQAAAYTVTPADEAPQWKEDWSGNLPVIKGYFSSKFCRYRYIVLFRAEGNNMQIFSSPGKKAVFIVRQNRLHVSGKLRLCFET